MTTSRAPLVAAIIALAICGQSAHQSSVSSVAPHFHHVHLRVADPAAAMDVYAKANGCTKTIVQGLGVGVRCGAAYLLFDRDTQPLTAPSVRGRVTVTGSGDAAVIRAEIAVADGSAITAWLRDRLGFDSTGAITFAPVAAASSLPDEIAHIAFGLADPAPLVSRLSSNGARVLTHGPESTTFAAPSGLAIEVVHDAGAGPDAYWCLMHPDVRSPTPGKCPICGMTLVPIPPPIFGDDRMDLVYKPSGKDRGHLTIRITDPKTGKPITSFATVHEKPFHLFIVSRDLSFFDHVHPIAHGDGSLTLDLTLPGPGMYMLYGDFYPTTGTPQLLQAPLITPDYRGSVFPDPSAVTSDSTTTKIVDGVRVTMTAPPLSGAHDAVLTFNLADATTGAPVTDIEPYLGAAGHLFMVSADLTDADHSHPSDFAAKGPTLKFSVRPPRPGLYKIWVQFQRAGRVITVAFALEVKLS